MFAEWIDSFRDFREGLAELDPGVFSGQECIIVTETLTRLANASAGAAARAAARAAECGAHRAKGYRHADDWVANTSGTSRRDAKDALDVGAATTGGKCPGVKEALEKGQLSLAQAAEITRTEARAPGSETELLALALTRPLSTLRDEARKRRQAVVDPAELARRHHAARELHHWLDSEGMVRFRGGLAPIVGIGLMNRLDDEADRIRRAARRAGSTEPRAAHCADALVKMLLGTFNAAGGPAPTEGADDGSDPSTGSPHGPAAPSGPSGGLDGSPGGPAATTGTVGNGRPASAAPVRATRADVVLVCDLEAFRRGHSHPGEVSRIVGGGPIPVSMVREALANDGFLKAVIHDGVKIDTVVHYGRHIKAELRTALELGRPPDFAGVICADGCGRRYNLEWDHVDPVANHGPTSFDNLEPRCWSHHSDKTERDRSAGLLHGLHKAVAKRVEAGTGISELEGLGDDRASP